MRGSLRCNPTLGVDSHVGLRDEAANPTYIYFRTTDNQPARATPCPP